MASPQVTNEGDDLQLLKLAANILNKQPRTSEKEWSSSIVAVRGANNSSP
jgi:hypothetical protein